MLNQSSSTSSSLERQTNSKTPHSIEHDEDEPKNMSHPSPPNPHHSHMSHADKEEDSSSISMAWNPMIKIKIENNQNDINHSIDHNTECSNQD